MDETGRQTAPMAVGAGQSRRVPFLACRACQSKETAPGEKRLLCLRIGTKEGLQANGAVAAIAEIDLLAPDAQKLAQSVQS